MLVLILECVMYMKFDGDVFTERQKCALWIKKLCERTTTDSDAK